ncbi:Pkinase domain-containing protein [Rhizoctonia solani AG-1 IA]|uniref:Pkinase domain-containing protein n=1 Tax=Thanatephorus cucumeris (strain AG1-IA) TaxID=983506 RepID=L8WMF6_THACA|nr:Pkinase domain-containing protein [Rhizoctonia solani AG-1 IA]
MLIAPENLGIQNITAYVTQTQASFANIDTGATANVYRDLESTSERTRQRTQKYFKNPPSKPEYIRFVSNPFAPIMYLCIPECYKMKEILAGLVHMHSFDPPIAHGDLKLASCLKSHARQSSNLRQANLLLSFDGIIKLCDFGQARFRNDQRGLASDASTTFESTHRFMSPELFVASPKVRPTNLSDVWAYGCVALQLLSRLMPYHTIKNEHMVPSAIMSGRSPSSKPEKPHAPRCLNNYLWNVIEWCWRPLEYRPNASRLLDELNRLIDSNLIDISSFTPDRMSLDFDGTMPSWPDNIVDFGDQGLSPNRKILCRGNRAELWVSPSRDLRYYPSSYNIRCQSANPPNTSSPKKDQIGSLSIFQMLEGLHYLHTFPTPIAHGDLNPVRTPIYHTNKPNLSYSTQSNIMVDGRGTLKLSTFSLSQIIISIPQAESSQPSADRIEVIRYLSPEMLSDSAMPSIRSDIWPYHETKREYDVERLIQRGVLPNDAQVLREETEVDGRFRQNRQREWLFNGISDRAENCWSPSGWPTANDLLIFVRELSSEMDELEDTSTWMSRVSNLSGSIIRPPILWVQGGSTSGSWRYPKASRLNPDPRTTKISMSWTNVVSSVPEPSIALKDTFGSPSSPAIVTEFCPNGTLGEVTDGIIVHGNLNMDVSRVLPIENLLIIRFPQTSVVVDKDGTAKIRNFEFAFQYAHNKSPGIVATVIRAPALAPMPSRWHPPEMFLETLGSDGSLMTQYNDLWAVGCLLAAICSSLEPYSGTDIPAVFSRIANKDKPYSRGDCSHRGVWNIAERLWGASIIDRISASDALREIAQYIN